MVLGEILCIELELILDLVAHYRRHGYGRWLAIVEDPQLGLGPVIRGELALRGVNDPAGPSKNGEAQSIDPSGRGQLF